jgi:hypothetical protein
MDKVPGKLFPGKLFSKKNLNLKKRNDFKLIQPQRRVAPATQKGMGIIS